MSDPVADLLAFIDRSPTPYHAVAEAARRLEADGFRPLSEGEVWELAPGARRYVVRGSSEKQTPPAVLIASSSGRVE